MKPIQRCFKLFNLSFLIVKGFINMNSEEYDEMIDENVNISIVEAFYRYLSVNQFHNPRSYHCVPMDDSKSDLVNRILICLKTFGYALPSLIGFEEHLAEPLSKETVMLKNRLISLWKNENSDLHEKALICLEYFKTEHHKTNPKFFIGSYIGFVHELPE